VNTDDHWLTFAVDLALANVAEGGGPFAAVVVADGMLVADGTNRVTLDLDPTAHAEVVAIRAACRTQGEFALEGATLFTSCEPCPLCLAACLWARLDQVVYAADRYAAASAGFDDVRFYELLALAEGEWPLLIERVEVPDSNVPFEAWNAKDDRVPY